MFFLPCLISEFLTKSLYIIIGKKSYKKNGVLSGKSNVTLLILLEQKYKFVDFLYTVMQKSDECPDYQSVLSRRLDPFI